mmetsp:Transcript_35566/g.77951  ORF Transcript_35566/g.77951 Transcript_35566/m.77951 type:complete len:369 (+) Transcript_35566:95-1201(+)
MMTRSSSSVLSLLLLGSVSTDAFSVHAHKVQNECRRMISSSSSSIGASASSTQQLGTACSDREGGGSGGEAPLKFAIIGHNIAYSVSPAMHNAAYESLNMPHSYRLIDEESVDDIVSSAFWSDDDFRGISVTIPHKQSIMPHLDELSDAAETIGAVNTVIVDKSVDGDIGEGGRTLRGDNTDWIGIYNPLKSRLGGDVKGGAALILGAGGTARAAAYAAAQLGLERMYYNRTPSKAQELADAFGGIVVTDLSGPSSGDSSDGKTLGDVCNELDTTVRVVLSTLPAAAGFELPEWLAANKSTIVFDVNYKPYWTPLLRQAEAAGLDVVRGSEMLWEQGARQFEIWLQQDAPYEVMKKVVLENCLPKDDD